MQYQTELVDPSTRSVARRRGGGGRLRGLKHPLDISFAVPALHCIRMVPLPDYVLESDTATRQSRV